MKLFIAVIFMASVMLVSAKDGYITARICPVQTAMDSGSAKAGILKQAQKVTILAETAEWIQIKTDTLQGYVNARFVGNEPVVVLSSVADGMKDMSNVEVRKRASTYTSSAAAIRGLSSENVRERENVAFSSYDFQSIKWIEENFSYTADVIEEFSLKELN